MHVLAPPPTRWAVHVAAMWRRCGGDVAAVPLYRRRDESATNGTHGTHGTHGAGDQTLGQRHHLKVPTPNATIRRGTVSWRRWVIQSKREADATRWQHRRPKAR